MKAIALSDLETLAVGLVALVVSTAIARRVPLLTRLNVPIAVVGGVLVAVIAALLYQFGGISFQFATRLTDFFLLVFFTTVGLSAKFSALKSGGRPLVILCVVTVILLIVQNAVGILVAWSAGAHPFYGLLIGSVSFVGGPGTAAAWAKEAQSMGLTRAPEIAVGAATFAVIVGAFVSGPITSWLIERRKLRGAAGPSPASWVAPQAAASVKSPPIATIMQVLLLIVAAVLAGDAVNAWARDAGFVLPGFLTAMLAGVAITNVGDAIGAKLDFVPIERGGEIALQAFLVMYLMSLKLWTLGAAIGPLLANVAIQVLVTALIGVLLLFRWLGRDYDAAVTVGGFLGFGLSSMPVAMATMDSVAVRYGPSPKAFLKAFLALPWFRV
jgi:ESS family glutamate:Na+ symporter